jgi:hypothetical protein
MMQIAATTIRAGGRLPNFFAPFPGLFRAAGKSGLTFTPRPVSIPDMQPTDDAAPSAFFDEMDADQLRAYVRQCVFAPPDAHPPACFCRWRFRLRDAAGT